MRFAPGFELDTANWLSWFRQDDRYSQEALSGDLEKLRSFYMDRGHADFRIESTQVAISPNKKDIYVTITIHEGEKYTISDIKMVGKMVVPEESLRALILAKPGSVFNLGLLTRSAEFMSFRLGEEGYANADIQPVPELDYDEKTVKVSFFVNPESRVYVRRINFNGVDEVDDQVLRREMRQNESAYLSNLLVDRSRSPAPAPIPAATRRTCATPPPTGGRSRNSGCQGGRAACRSGVSRPAPRRRRSRRPRAGRRHGSRRRRGG